MKHLKALQSNTAAGRKKFKKHQRTVKKAVKKKAVKKKAVKRPRKI